jgi:hypothetical protein
VKRIDCVYLLTHKYYQRLTRICVASIRHWYPDTRIVLFKDEGGGPFDTSEIERIWNVEVLKTADKQFGWGFGHFDLLLMPQPERFLAIDVDIVFTGRLLDRLEAYDADLIIDEEDHPANPTGKFGDLYFKLDKLAGFDPAFRFPGYAFNAGQFVGTTGIFRKSDFDGLVEWSSPRRSIRTEIFNFGDQGIFNYLVMKLEAAGRLTVARVPFMRWEESELDEIELAKLGPESPYPTLIHWAGRRAPRMKDMLRADILFTFEDLYYSRVPFGAVRRAWRHQRDRVLNLVNRVAARLTGRSPMSYLT